MKSKRIRFESANDLYDCNKEATKCKTEVRIQTKSEAFNFDAKTLLGLFFAMNLSDLEVIYSEEETEFDEFLKRLEVKE